MRRIRTAAALAAASALLAASIAYAATGDITQKAGTAGCVSNDGTGGACQDGVALSDARAVAVSEDGKSVYVVSQFTTNAVTIFDRNTSTGELTQKAGTAGCVSESGTGGACQDGAALDFAESVAVSPDGKSVYVGSGFSDAVAIFDRDTTTGALTQKAGTAGCVSETGTGGVCQDGVALDDPRSIAVSEDGTSVYVASAGSSDAVLIFDRNTSTGALTQKAGTAGCVSETGTGGSCQDGVALDGAYGVAASPDGKSIYIGANSSDAVAVFDRNISNGELTQKAGTAGCVSDTGTAGACQDGVALEGAVGVAVSPDAESTYVASDLSDAVAIFDRNPSTGGLTQKAGTAGCVSETGTVGACQDGVALDAALGVALSDDGASAYVSAFNADALAIFDRDTSTGALTQNAGTAGCVSETGTAGACQDGVALDAPAAVDVSADGRSVYAASQASGAVAILDREPLQISIDNVAVTEGDAGQTATSFTVTLNNASSQQVTVGFATSNGSAAAPGDYASSSGTATFAANDTTETVTVQVNGDTMDEPNETFNVDLSNATIFAAIADAQGVGTINDDDPVPSISIDDVAVTEGDAGQTPAAFTVSLTNASSQQVTVDFATSDASASAPGDYASNSGTATFTSGDTSEPVTVQVNGDTIDEADETFNLGLSNPTIATIADNQGVGTITDDDVTIPLPPAPGPGLGDATPPETTITKGPKDKTKKRTATFEFSANEAATFECSLDGKSVFKPCTSPFTVKVKKGKHTFQVQARDTAGNLDATPATDSWKVKKKRK